jgi:hypothetical protein
MQQPDGNGAALDTELADQLLRGRPVPAAQFRGALGRHLTRLDPGYGPRPTWLRGAVLALVASGLLVLAVAGLVFVGGH